MDEYIDHQDKLIAFTVKNKKKIYCAAPLFSPLDRIGAAHLAAFVEKAIHEYIVQQKLKCRSKDFVFLPFRDSKQTNITGSDRSKLIYQKDIAALKNSSAILARIDGIVKDCGVGLEIGHAYGLGIPVGVLLTDFIWEGACNNNTQWQLDPILEQIASYFQLSRPLMLLKDSYYLSNKILEETAVAEFVKMCIENLRTPQKNEPNPGANKNTAGIYVDFMGGRFDWARTQQEYIKDNINFPGVKVSTSERFFPENVENMDTLRKKSREDLQNALNCSIAIFSGDSPQMDFGSSILLGMCVALQKTVILQFSANVCFKGEGGQIMKLNSMIDQSVDYITNTIYDSTKLLNKIIAQKDFGTR